MTRPKILLYLHHVELGQRYPISEDVVVGRLMGHILFPKDERLSNQHCRIYQAPNGGLMIRDLGSEHGTVVDGRLLSPEKSYPIKDGTLIAVGSQVFKCVEPSNRPVRRKKPKKRRPRTDYSWFFALVFFAAASALAYHYRVQLLPLAKHYGALLVYEIKVRYEAQKELPPAPPIHSPFEIVYREIESAYAQYRQIGKEVQAGRLDGKAMAGELRGNLIPKFKAAQAKLGVLKPSNEWERRRIEANTALVTAILKQISAMASFAETKNPKYSAEVDKLTREVETASEQAKKVNDRRMPAAM